MATRRPKKSTVPRITLLEIGVVFAILALIAGTVAIVLAS